MKASLLFTSRRGSGAHGRTLVFNMSASISKVEPMVRICKQVKIGDMLALFLVSLVVVLCPRTCCYLQFIPAVLFICVFS